MTGFAGYDRSDYPGDAVTDWLKANTNLVWCGYYLAPAPSHSGTSWMGKRTRLADWGWGVAPLYVGRQTVGPGARMPDGTNGKTDGAQAAELLSSEGFDQASIVYLDLENGPPLTSDQEDYIAAWCTEIRNAGFAPGLYCSHLLAQTAHTLQPDIQIWAFKVSTTAAHPVPAPYPDPNPVGSGYAGARIWQLGQECILTISAALGGKLQVDLNSASVNDPGGTWRHSDQLTKSSMSPRRRVVSNPCGQRGFSAARLFRTLVNAGRGVLQRRGDRPKDCPITDGDMRWNGLRSWGTGRTWRVKMTATTPATPN